ncbi:hypothetical protein J6590_026644 [Homalodisca vitripennis]|nr:hypothetical protein J6590_026644 [Homalodisca vitripennis]
MASMSMLTLLHRLTVLNERAALVLQHSLGAARRSYDFLKSSENSVFDSTSGNFTEMMTLILSTMPARCAVLRTACSFRKKINSSLQKSNPRSRDAPDP